MPKLFLVVLLNTFPAPFGALKVQLFVRTPLSMDIETVFNSPGGAERYWEQVPLVYKKSNYRVEVRECKSGDVYEIDSYAELKAFDKTYDL